MKQTIQEKRVPHCVRKECGGLVKPDIVFFGEQLPEEFFRSRGLPGQADLCIVMGSSLTVQPFASLPGLCREGTPRTLINYERVGSLGTRPDDVLLLGDCDEGVRKLAEACGWLEELEALWAKTAPGSPTEGGQRQKEKEPEKSRDEKVQEEIDRLTGEIDSSLKLSQQHHRDTLSVAGKGEKPKEERAENSSEGEAKTEARDRPGPSSCVKDEDGGEGEEESSPGDLKHVYPHIEAKTKTKNKKKKKKNKMESPSL